MSGFIATDRGRGLRVGWGPIGLIVAVCTGFAGCGKSDSLPVLEVHDVKGTVLLADGQPLDGGRIYFVSKAGDLPVTPSGAIGPDGTFSLVTGGSGDGVPRVNTRSESSRHRSKQVARRAIRHFRSGTTMKTARALSSQFEPRPTNWTRFASIEARTPDRGPTDGALGSLVELDCGHRGDVGGGYA